MANDEEDVEIVLVRMSSPDKAHNEQVLEALEARLESAGLGEVAGTMNMGDDDVTLMLEVTPSLAAHAESIVIPQVQAMLQHLGVTEHVVVELALDADDDGEGWDEDVEEYAEEDAPEEVAPVSTPPRLGPSLMPHPDHAPPKRKPSA